jgi:gamma-glutamylcyclotransferase (GGCT)/AIG2-like uncharacterized protein YtfP
MIDTSSLDDPTHPSGSIRLFVYGTLKPGQCNEWVYRDYPVGVMGAIARGYLYHLPLGYPGFVPSATADATTAPVQGALLTCADPRILAVLDDFEQHDPGAIARLLPGVDPTTCGYTRRQIPLWDTTGTAIPPAWAYCMTEAQVQQLQGVGLPQGRWESP